MYFTHTPCVPLNVIILKTKIEYTNLCSYNTRIILNFFIFLMRDTKKLYFRKE
jgi:hypothetical protein